MAPAMTVRLAATPPHGERNGHDNLVALLSPEGAE